MVARVLLVLLLTAACEQPTSLRFGSELHNNPARCGMEPYAWVDDASLGSVITREPIRAYEADFIEELLVSLRETAVVDRVPRYQAFLDRFTYVTQDRGKLVQATGMYAWPIGEGPFPIIVVTHGTTGYSDACAPSAIAMNNPVAPDALMLGALASFGYVAVSSDYLGLKSMGDASTMRHPYIVGEPTAIASLDAARAAYNMAAADGVELGPLFIAGASQGGHAAAMTVRYQPHYASELQPLGALYLIPPLNLLGHARRVLSEDVDPVTLGNMGAVLMGHAAWFGQDLTTILKPEWAAYIEETTSTSCALPEIDAPLEDVLVPDALAAARGDFDFAPWDCMLKESSLVQTTIPRLDSVPALVVTGEIDTLVDAQIEREGAHELCEQGLQIRFVECDGQDHGGAVATSINAIFEFIEARLSGAPLEDVCVDRAIEICASDPRNYP
jgi:acetyl esterase/lipase